MKMHAQEFRNEIQVASQHDDLPKLHALKTSLKDLEEMVNQGIKKAKLVKYKAKAKCKFDAEKKRFYEEAKVGEVLATVFDEWLAPELTVKQKNLHRRVHVNDEDEDEDEDEDYEKQLLEWGEWGYMPGQPWFEHNEVIVCMDGVDADTKYAGWFTFEVNRLLDDGCCCEWYIEPDNELDYPVGRQNMKAVTEACKVLLANTKCELLRTVAYDEKHHIETGRDYVDATVDFWFSAYVVKRCWMSATRVAWMTAVVRGVVKKNI